MDPKEEKRAYNRLMAGSSYFACGRYLKSIEEVRRQEIYTHYEFERLERKYNEILKCYLNESHENWHQTLLMYFFQYLGDPKNKEVYKRFARRVTYNAILRERSNPLRLEALMLGTSGLLKDYNDDLYTLSLKQEAEYLMRKHNITPMSSSEWNTRSIRPQNSPVIRIAQAAALFIKHELLFDKLIECRCIEDIEEIFSVEASEYWTTHYIPSKVTRNEVKRLGSDKCNMLGINLVVMLQYAYGSYTANDEIIDRAQNLIQDLRAESNMIVNKWRNYGLRPKTAFETQALLQLGTVYCQEARCHECYVGARAIKNLSWLDNGEE